MTDHANKPLAIVAALPQELACLIQGERLPPWGPGMWRGELGETPVAVALLGIGKVRAAACCQHVLDHCHPRAVLHVGTAGSINPELNVGDLVVARRVAQHDLVLDDAGRARHSYPVWQETPEEILRAARESGQDLGPEVNIRVGQIVTGDRVIRDTEERQRLREHWQADCADMESAAVALVCAQQGVPCLVVRAISDRCDHNTSQDFRANMPALSQLLASFVVAVVPRLAHVTAGRSPQQAAAPV